MWRLVFALVIADFLPSTATLDLSGTDSALYPFDTQQETYQLPPTSMYPYFLFPGSATLRTSYEVDTEELESLTRNRHRHKHHRNEVMPELPGNQRDNKIKDLNSYNVNNNEIAETVNNNNNNNKHDYGTEHKTSTMHHEQRLVNNKNAQLSSINAQPPRPTPTVDESVPARPAPSKKFAPRPTYEHGAFFERADDYLEEHEARNDLVLPAGFGDQGLFYVSL